MARRLPSPLGGLYLLLPLLLLSWAWPAVTAAAPGTGQEFLALVAADLAEGRLTAEEALLHRFQYGFAPDQLPARYRVPAFSPLRCATSLITEYAAERERLSPETIARIDAWLQPTAVSKAQYLSPSGRFALSYDTSGADAVAAADLDPANGIPDYVEKIALYFDEAWAVVVDSLGFTAPPLSGGTYAISFESMQYYGYTVSLNAATGATRIVMHNSYIGFPANDDPEGVVAGAARATAAHEFKHAAQYAATRWVEGGWNELDATWIEDVVFDQVNDYYNYLLGESPLRHPQLPLDGGANTTGSYEDCVWQTWMAETWGVAVIRDYWNRRQAFPGEAVIASYEAVLGTRSTTLAEGWAAFTAWNYGVGVRAVAGVGYEEAAAYPDGPVVATASAYPFATTGSVAHLAADFVRLDGFVDGSNEMLRVVFTGQDAAGPLTLAVHVTKRDGTGLVETIALDPQNDADHLLSIPVRDILSAGVIVGNAATFGLPGAWDLELELVPIPVVPQLGLDRLDVSVSLIDGMPGRENVRVTNVGEAGSLLDFTAQLWTTHPDSGLGTKRPRRPTEKGVTGSTLTCATASYLPGETLNLDFTVFNGSSDDEWIRDLSLDFPAGVFVLASSDFVGGSLGSLVTDGSSGDDALISWHGSYGSQEYGVVRDGESAYGAVQVQIGPGFKGDLAIDWLIAGDGFGSAPHQITGAVTLAEDSPILELQYPNTGEIVAVDDSFTVSWSTGGSVPAVDLDLSRDGGQNWELVVGNVVNDGSCRLALSGPPSNDCLLRLRATEGNAETVSDGPFHLYASPPWITGSATSGTLLESEYQDVVLDIDTATLEPGSYRAWLVVLHNAPAARTVLPVSLLVAPDPSSTGPRRVFAMHGAHPNPFNPRTTIAFELPAASRATVDVLDLRGHRVRRLFEGELTAGAHRLAWNGRDAQGRGVSAGAYLVRVRADGHAGTVKVLLAK